MPRSPVARKLGWAELNQWPLGNHPGFSSEVGGLGGWEVPLKSRTVDSQRSGEERIQVDGYQPAMKPRLVAGSAGLNCLVHVRHPRR